MARSSGYDKMRESWNFGHRSHENVLQISKPIHKTPVEMEFRRPGDFQPGAFQDRRVRSDAIGVAISPPGEAAAVHGPSVTPVRTPQGRSLTHPRQSPQAQAQAEQSMSSPIRPILTLSIPREEAQLPPRAPPMPVGSSKNADVRDSVVTEFAEDGESDHRATANTQIWRPPPSDPQSATTYYVADKWGNWIMASANGSQPPPPPPPIEMPSPRDKTKAEKAKDALAAQKTVAGVPSSTLLEPARYAPVTPKLGSPIRFRDNGSAPRATSSVYSDFSPPQVVKPGPENPLPPPKAYMSLPRDKYEAGNTTAAQGTGTATRARNMPVRRSTGWEHRPSRDSATDIEDDVSDDELLENAGQVELSPVVESPRATGLSPVSYPRIQPHTRVVASSPTAETGDVMAETGFFPPLRTRTANPTKTAQSAAQPGLALGPAATVPSTGPPPQVPPKTAAVPQQFTAYKPSQKGFPPRTVNLNPNRNPAQILTGSPETRVGAFPATGPGSRVAAVGEERAVRQPPAVQAAPRVMSPGQQRKPSPRMLDAGQESRERADPRRMPPPITSPAAVGGYHQQQGKTSPAATSPFRSLPPTRLVVRQQEPSQPQLPKPQPQQQQQQQQWRPSYQAPPQQQNQERQRQQEQEQEQREQQEQQRQQEERQRQLQQQQQRPHQNAPMMDAPNVASSSLLAKRLGSDRAAALVLGGPGSSSKKSAAWKRQLRESQLAAQGQEGQMAHQLPATPGWLPRLTPTRKGGDLFLSVQ